MSAPKDYYAILEITPDTPLHNIKRAWKEQLQIWHPDRFMHSDSLREKAENRTKDINEAYAVLGHEGSRKAYDDQRVKGKETRNEDARSSTANSTDFILPFNMDEGTLDRAVYSYMTEGQYTPDDLLSLATIVKRERIFVPCYFFHGYYAAHWTATFGYDRQEHYTQYQQQYDHNTRRYRSVPVTRTRTVTDWRPYSGTTKGAFQVMAYAGKTIPEAYRPLIAKMDRADEIVASAARYLDGFSVETFAMTESDAYAGQVDSVVSRSIDKSVGECAQGDRQRDWHWKAEMNHGCKKVLVPIGHAVFEYRNKQYRVWVDGNRPERRMGDSLPSDTSRIRDVRLGFVPAAISLVASILAYVLHPNESKLVLWTSLLCGCLLVGWLRRTAIIQYSQQVRQRMLTEKSSVQPSQPLMKPTLANTSYDAVLIPLLSTAILIGLLLPPMLSGQEQAKDVDVPPHSTFTGEESSGSKESAPPKIVKNKVSHPRTPSPETQVTKGDGTATRPGKLDYSWLVDDLALQIKLYKQYPASARKEGLEGKAVIKAVIREDGQVIDIQLEESTGHQVLDNSAIELVRAVSPLSLKQPLGKEQVTLRLPVIYSLK